MVDAMLPRPVHDEWDPRSPAALADQVRVYDAMRRRCPVAHSDSLQWSVFRHADVLRVLHDPATFSNAVSAHVSVPNGMDPPQHTAWRRLIEPYFGADVLAAYEPACRAIAQDLVRELPARGDVEWMDAFARRCALRMLCAFMGWPATLQAPLQHWAQRQQAATLAQDRAALAALAVEFDGHIRAQLTIRKAADAGADLTSRLLRERIDGRPLDEAHLVSIVRNWTVGELSTMAASFGILAGYLATHPALQQALRAQPGRLPAAIEEILRMDPPLIANRRVVRRATELGGRALAAGDKLSLIWASANRDEAVFGDPDEFRPGRDPQASLLWGAGIHVCPGAPLARLQMRVVLEALLAATRRISGVPGRQPVKACYPTGGYALLPLRIERVE
jgi:cytochrome P450